MNLVYSFGLQILIPNFYTIFSTVSHAEFPALSDGVIKNVPAFHRIREKLGFLAKNSVGKNGTFIFPSVFLCNIKRTWRNKAYREKEHSILHRMSGHDHIVYFKRVDETCKNKQ